MNIAINYSTKYEGKYHKFHSVGKAESLAEAIADQIRGFREMKSLAKITSIIILDTNSVMKCTEKYHQY